MKGLICFVLLLPVFAYSQSTKEQRKQFMAMADTCNFPKPFEFSFIDSIPLSRQQIFTKCAQWLATNMANYKTSAQMHDSLTGKIVIPDIISVYKNEYRYTLTIDVRDGKYRLVFNNFFQANTSVYYNKNVPFDTIAEMKMVYLGPGTKKQYWQAEKLHELQEIQNIRALMKAYVAKKDDF